MRHLNSFLARGGGHLNKTFPKIQMPGGLPGRGMLKLHFDWYISSLWDVKEPTHYSRTVGDEVPGVVAVLCEYVLSSRSGRPGVMSLKRFLMYEAT